MTAPEREAIATPTASKAVALAIACSAAVAAAGCQSPPRELARLLGTDILAGRKHVRIHIQRFSIDYTYGVGYIRFDATASDVTDACERIRAAGGRALPIEVLAPSWAAEDGLELSWWTPTTAVTSPACAYALDSGGLVIAKLEGGSAFVRVRIP